MPLELRHAVMPDEIPALIRACTGAFLEPFNRAWLIDHPIFGDTPEAHEASCLVSISRAVERNEADPSETWLKVVDTDTGEIAAIALYNIYEKCPDLSVARVNATWWPEGARRHYINQMVYQGRSPRLEMTRSPHVFLRIMATCKQYRGRGAATLLLDWVARQADDRGFDTWLNTTAHGARALYEKNGYAVARSTNIQPLPSSDDEAQSAEWQDMESMFMPMVRWTMRRPPQTGN